MLKTEGSRQVALDRDDAEAIGVKVLEYLAAEPVQFRRFLDLSGIEVGDLRSAAKSPAFFAGLLDFVLGHEPTLLAFAAEAGLAPEKIGAARETLSRSFGTVPR